MRKAPPIGFVGTALAIVVLVLAATETTPGLTIGLAVVAAVAMLAAARQTRKRDASR